MIALGSKLTGVRNVRFTGPSTRYIPFEGLCDLIIVAGRVVDIAPAGAMPLPGQVWDAQGAWVIPGLWDHHVHSSPTALQLLRTNLSSARSAAQAARMISHVQPAPDARRIATHIRDGLWPDEPTLALLDEATGGIATYLINADLHSIWMNTAAHTREGFPLTDSGVIREADAFDVGRRLDHVAPEILDAAIGELADRAAARGVVGIIDYNFGWNLTPWARRADDGFDAFRVQFGVYPNDLAAAIATGLSTGDVLDERGLITVGSLKAITDGSLGTRTAACSHAYPDATFGSLSIDRDELIDLMTMATGAGFACAIHAIGDVANSHALDAFAQTGAWGTIEHAQLLAHADVPRFARLGVSASVQPTHAVDDRDLVDSQWSAQTGAAFPMRSLHDAGANLLFGSDSPVAPLDPWIAIADATERTSDEREPWQAHERLRVAEAIAASVSGSQIEPLVEVGMIADLAFMPSDPYQADGSVLRTMPIAATLVGGHITHLG